MCRSVWDYATLLVPKVVQDSLPGFRKKSVPLDFGTPSGAWCVISA